MSSCCHDFHRRGVRVPVFSLLSPTAFFLSPFSPLLPLPPILLLSVFLHLMLDYIRHYRTPNRATDRSQERFASLMRQIPTRCTTDQGRAETALARGGVHVMLVVLRHLRGI